MSIWRDLCKSGSEFLNIHTVCAAHCCLLLPYDICRNSAIQICVWQVGWFFVFFSLVSFHLLFIHTYILSLFFCCYFVLWCVLLVKLKYSFILTHTNIDHIFIYVQPIIIDLLPNNPVSHHHNILDLFCVPLHHLFYLTKIQCGIDLVFFFYC